MRFYIRLLENIWEDIGFYLNQRIAFRIPVPISRYVDEDYFTIVDDSIAYNPEIIRDEVHEWCERNLSGPYEIVCHMYSVYLSVGRRSDAVLVTMCQNIDIIKEQVKDV